ncbi:MAG: prepilin-type N-terminal cleavage/methylation domain-containing protein [Chloroflexota bacterium]|nr:prepilin-type N-terminal cleavage/methylation domain-containing protein [Chloroflexota bacterium]
MKLNSGRKAAQGNSRGFTLIELLVVMVILMILVGVVTLSVGNVFDRAKRTAYITVKDQIQTAVVAYQIESLGSYPLTDNTTTINGTAYGVIDMCALLSSADPPGMLRDLPDGCADLAANDNCESAECTCDPASHYVWAIDILGNVHSTCINTSENEGGCTNGSVDGFQTVWP